jgi:hypothetical protein
MANGRSSSGCPSPAVAPCSATTPCGPYPTVSHGPRTHAVPLLHRTRRPRAAASPAHKIVTAARCCGGSSRAPPTLPPHLPALARRPIDTHSCPPSRSAGRAHLPCPLQRGAPQRHQRRLYLRPHRRWVGFAWNMENTLGNTGLTPLTTSSRCIFPNITTELD